LHDYTHQLVVGYKCAVPNIVGFFRIKVFSQLGNVLANQRVSYKPTELEYSVALARRAANDRITTVEISEFDQGDLFDVWARLNVTD
jgi:hypothetical protein